MVARRWGAAMKTILLRVWVLWVLLGFSHAAQADTTLTYTGNSFDTFSGDYACPPQCGLSMSITISGPLTNYLFSPGHHFKASGEFKIGRDQRHAFLAQFLLVTVRLLNVCEYSPVHGLSPKQ
jgi:hypothetical protein